MNTSINLENCSHEPKRAYNAEELSLIIQKNSKFQAIVSTHRGETLSMFKADAPASRMVFQRMKNLSALKSSVVMTASKLPSLLPTLFQGLLAKAEEEAMALFQIGSTHRNKVLNMFKADARASRMIALRMENLSAMKSSVAAMPSNVLHELLVMSEEEAMELFQRENLFGTNDSSILNHEESEWMDVGHTHDMGLGREEKRSDKFPSNAYKTEGISDSASGYTDDTTIISLPSSELSATSRISSESPTIGPPAKVVAPSPSRKKKLTECNSENKPVSCSSQAIATERFKKCADQRGNTNGSPQGERSILAPTSAARVLKDPDHVINFSINQDHRSLRESEMKQHGLNGVGLNETAEAIASKIDDGVSMIQQEGKSCESTRLGNTLSISSQVNIPDSSRMDGNSICPMKEAALAVTEPESALNNPLTSSETNRAKQSQKRKTMVPIPKRSLPRRRCTTRCFIHNGTASSDDIWRETGEFLSVLHSDSTKRAANSDAVLRGQFREHTLPAIGPKTPEEDILFKSWKGVTLQASGNYFAKIRHKREWYAVGTYKLQSDAALAYDKAARLLKGPMCQLNFKKEQHYKDQRAKELNEKGLDVDSEETVAAISSKTNEAIIKIGKSNGENVSMGVTKPEAMIVSHAQKRIDADTNAVAITIERGQYNDAAHTQGKPKSISNLKELTYHMMIKEYEARIKHQCLASDSALTNGIAPKKLQGSSSASEINFTTEQEHQASREMELKTTGLVVDLPLTKISSKANEVTSTSANFQGKEAGVGIAKPKTTTERGQCNNKAAKVPQVLPHDLFGMANMGSSQLAVSDECAEDATNNSASSKRSILSLDVSSNARKQNLAAVQIPHNPINDNWELPTPLEAHPLYHPIEAEREMRDITKTAYAPKDNRLYSHMIYEADKEFSRTISKADEEFSRMISKADEEFMSITASNATDVCRKIDDIFSVLRDGCKATTVLIGIYWSRFKKRHRAHRLYHLIAAERENRKLRVAFPR